MDKRKAPVRCTAWFAAPCVGLGESNDTSVHQNADSVLIRHILGALNFWRRECHQIETALRRQAGRVGFEPVVPNPKLKLLEPVLEVSNPRHYSIRTEQAYCDWR